MNIKDIRVANINLLAEKLGRSALASEIGYKDTVYVNQLCLGLGSFGSRTARKIEACLELPSGWMDVEQTKILSAEAQADIDEIVKLFEGEESAEKRKRILEFAKFSTRNS